MITYIALKLYDKNYIFAADNINEFLKAYYEYHSGRHKKTIDALIDSERLSIENLVEFINSLLDPDDEILEIHTLKERII